MCSGNWRLRPGGPGKLIGKLGDGLSSDLNGLLESILTGLLASSMSLWALEPPFAAEGVQFDAESGRSGVGLECPFDGVPARSGEQSENFRIEIGVCSFWRMLLDDGGGGEADEIGGCGVRDPLGVLPLLAIAAEAEVR